ncbi:MAG: hypothetical protein KAV25_09305 [Methanophagales archaeon]|nr:hypothetical protein [Methanophagales archaeon]
MSEINFSFSQGFLFREKVVNEKPVLIDVRGMFEGKGAKRKGFIIGGCDSNL